MDDTLIPGGDFFMAKKGQTFRTYSEEFKIKAVEAYLNGEGSYISLAKDLGIRNASQLKTWVRKYQSGCPLRDSRGMYSEENPLIGRPKKKFESIEQELEYYKAQVHYLKKRYPNLHGEVKSKRK